MLSAPRHARDQAPHLQVSVHAARAAGLNVPYHQFAQPARCASAITGTRPARDTRFGSSNQACVLARACNNRIYKVFSRTGSWKL